jgi:hypothetical protein
VPLNIGATRRRLAVSVLAGAAAVAAVAAVGVAGVHSHSRPDDAALTSNSAPLLRAHGANHVVGKSTRTSGATAPTPNGPDSDAVFLSTFLKGKNEVPTLAGPRVGDRNGRAVSVLRIAGDQVCYSLAWSGIGAPTLGHVHAGEKGVNGDVAIPLFGTAMPDTVRAAAGCVTADGDVVDALKDRPEDFYANMHTEKFPGGAVRGQYRKLDRAVQLLDGFIDGKLVTLGSGEAEVPTAGDPAASFIGTVTPKGSRVRFAANWSGFTSPTIGHIHEGAAGVAGKPVVDLFEAPKGLSPELFAVAGVSDNVDRKLVRDIAKNPEQFYFNLHTLKFTAGIARGQLEENGQVVIAREATGGANGSAAGTERTDGNYSSDGDYSIYDESRPTKSDGNVVEPY